MRLKSSPGGVAALLAVALGVFVTGCTNEKKGDEAKGKSPKAAEKETGKDNAHDHSRWWCSEHGVPEEVCGQCDAKVAAEFQKNGQWCEKHNRPKPQCFKCDPALKEKFAAEYRAKYGKDPPEPKE